MAKEKSELQNTDDFVKLARRVLTPFPMTTMVDPETGEMLNVSSGMNALGQEIPDPVPMEIPVGMHQGATLADTVRRMVQNQLLAVAAEAEGFETFEEADDFELEDDPADPHTPYEAVFDPKPKPAPTPPEPVPPAASGSGGGGGTPPPPTASTATPAVTPAPAASTSTST